MGSINYFEFICFLWALIGIGSRVAMAIMQERWKEWELNNAYTAKKPKWVNFAALIAYFLVGYTWYSHFTSNIKYSWIIAILVTSSIIKVSNVMFNYEAFRKFVAATLNDKKKMLQLNISVIIFSVILIWMGIYLY